MKPLIGITAGTVYNKERPDSPFVYGQSHTYVEAVQASGGVPIILPIMDDPAEALEMIARLDGVLFAGGNDLEPNMYGEQNRFSKEIDSIRDNYEVALMERAFAAKMPVLAICRGMQLLNVVRGGTLYQDILKDVPGAHNHDGDIKEDDVKMLLHSLSISPESALSRILKTTKLQANTFHHQAVHEVGSGLIVNAMSDDGIIEGIEDMSNGYVMAVQAHPESLFRDIEPHWKLLFESFIDACKKPDHVAGS